MIIPVLFKEVIPIHIMHGSDGNIYKDNYGTGISPIEALGNHDWVYLFNGVWNKVDAKCLGICLDGDAATIVKNLMDIPVMGSKFIARKGA